VSEAASFTGLVDLAAASLGGRAVGASDEFFAAAENLILPGRGVFIPGKFTDRGKWMDGWESRRKRVPGHDFCILELGVTGIVAGFDIDTHHFSGNHPPFAAVEGLNAARGTPFQELTRLPWTELLAQSPILPDAQNLFAAIARPPVSHVRLSIYPDGGVARFRVFGRAQADWARGDVDSETQALLAPGLVDLAALKNGARVLACSDAHFGPMNNLLLPGRAEHMGGGWETRRKRGPGHDWILVELGARGTPRLVEVDTAHFKGNYPERCALSAIDAPGARITDLIASGAWRPLLAEARLTADTRHFFREELTRDAPASHVRLDVFPDGGVSRLRVWGERDG
jgi:allantoicase